ncbi:MAG: mechanosensitive ion channel domain-containing protein [Xanthomonadales bacterium]|jgi:small-conductance mechanosensitive channel|nr:mechanosensitive ion channel domain-containing protein [Xanthomonadales bacterium]
MEFLANLWNNASELLSRQLFMFGDTPITLSQVLAAPLLLVFGLIAARILIGRLAKRLTRKGVDDNLVLLVKRGIWVVAITVLLLLALSILNVSLTAFTFISGAVAIGVGFGAQAIINNFISGWILMGERPIRIGDVLEFQGTLGKVEAINTRSTLIRRIDGVHIVTPNSFLLENTVINWTLVDNEIRTQVRVGVAYGSPVREVERLICQAGTEHADVLNDPPPVVIFDDFGDNALAFDLYVWTHLRPGGDLRKLRSDLRFRITELFDEAGIVIAFPQRDVHLDGELALVDKRSDSGNA